MYIINWVIFVIETGRVCCAVRLNIKVWSGDILIFKGLNRVVEQAGNGPQNFDVVVNCIMWRMFGGF